MKKNILGLLGLLVVLSAPLSAARFDYTDDAYTPVPFTSTENYVEGTVILTQGKESVKHSTEDVSIISKGEGDNYKKSLEGVMLPKYAGTLSAIPFENEDDAKTLLSKIPFNPDGTPSDSNKVVEVRQATRDLRNNVPHYVYYRYQVDGEDKVEKLRYKDGSYVIVRTVESEDLHGLTKEKASKEDFVFNDGYIKAEELPKMLIGEIKEATASDFDDTRAFIKDKANMGVSGDTVFKYIKNNVFNPVGLTEAADIAAWKEKLGVGQGAAVSGDGSIAIDGVISDTDAKKDNAVSGLTVFNYLKDDKDKSAVAVGNTHILTGDKVALFLAEEKKLGKVEDGNTNFVTGDTVYKALEKSKADMKKVVAGTSTAVALANLPFVYPEDAKNSVAAGVGYYAGHAGVALGYERKLLDKDSMKVRLDSAFNTAGEFAAGAGVGFGW